MIIYSILIHENSSQEKQLLQEAYELSSFGFFQRGTIQEFIKFFAQTLTERTNVNVRQTVEEKNMVGHVHALNGITLLIVTDKEYPTRAAFSLLTKIYEEINNKYTNNYLELKNLNNSIVKEYIIKYQDAKKADAILKIQDQLDETKIIMNKTLESVLERGEKLDNLVERSNNLSSQSKMFYKGAKKANSCCIIS